MYKKRYEKTHLKVIELGSPMDPRILEAVQTLQKMAREAKENHNLSRFSALKKLAARLMGQT